MKAIAKCSKCGEMLTTSCRACIDGESSGCEDEGHEHDGDFIEGIKWKKVPETEKELEEVEEK